MTDAPRRALRPCVFLDRDGTLNREVDFLTDPDEVELLPGVAAALGRLRDAGYARVVVTNQSGIARGYLDEARLARIHERLESLLAAAEPDPNVPPAIERFYFCPHHPTEFAGGAEAAERYGRACRCRKPGSEMLERASDELGLDLSRSYLVGDALRDLDAAAALGVPGLLVRTGKGRAQERAAVQAGLAPHVVEDLAAAVDWILAAGARSG